MTFLIKVFGIIINHWFIVRFYAIIPIIVLLVHFQLFADQGCDGLVWQNKFKGNLSGLTIVTNKSEVAIANLQGAIFIADSITGKVKHFHEIHNSGVKSMASADSPTLIITGTAHSEIALLNPARKTPTQYTVNLAGNLSCLGITENALRVFAVAGKKSSDLYVLDGITGKTSFSVSQEKLFGTPDQQIVLHLFVASEDRITIVSTSNVISYDLLADKPIFSLSSGGASNYIAAGTRVDKDVLFLWKNGLEVRSAKTGELSFERNDLNVGDTKGTQAGQIAVSPKDSIIAIAMNRPFKEPSRIILLDYSKPDGKWTSVESHAGLTTGLAFSHDGESLFSCGNDGNLCKWNVANILKSAK